MAKFYGKIGFGETVEKASGVWEDVVVEKDYYGDVLRNQIKQKEGEQANAEFSVSNSISIVADEYANTHFFAIRYIRWAGTYWTLINVEVKRPRLILTLGGVYNGPTATAPNAP